MLAAAEARGPAAGARCSLPVQERTSPLACKGHAQGEQASAASLMRKVCLPARLLGCTLLVNATGLHLPVLSLVLFPGLSADADVYVSDLRVPEREGTGPSPGSAAQHTEWCL